jgi:hypothetical protein
MTGEPVAGERNPLETAADLLVYAPVGLAVVARDLLPGLAERGRAEVASQVDLARTVGRLVVSQGHVERAVGNARQQVGSLLDHLVRLVSGVGDEAAPAPAGQPAGPAATAAARAGAATPGEVATGAAAAPSAATLAITDYDSLAASQVVPRLASLAPDELEAVRAYEAATRGRRTVLGRIAQLQG